LTDELIEGAIDSISGYLVSDAAYKMHLPVSEVMIRFLSSHTYQLLTDKSTGYYWDSLLELQDMLWTELQKK
jgi:hypothetical protein